MPARDLDRLRELVSIGAGHAAGALAALVGRTFRMRVPQVLPLPLDRAPREWSPDAPASGSTGVFFEVVGAVEGIVALLLPAAARDALVRAVVGAEPAAVPSRKMESALREIGNIAVSRMCSAIADTLGARVVPSIPVLAIRDAESVLASLVAHRCATGEVVRVETELFDRQGEWRGRLVVVQELPAKPSP